MEYQTNEGRVTIRGGGDGFKEATVDFYKEVERDEGETDKRLSKD